MTMDRTTQYPHHLARRVAERLRGEGGRSPPETVLTELLETLYFASLRSDGRRVFWTVSYIDPADAEGKPPARPPGPPAIARFERLLPFDLQTLRKLGRAAEPAVASLAVCSDRKRGLVIWGMLDEMPGRRPHGENGSPEGPSADWPEVFRVVVTGPGNLAVYSRETLVASLVRNTLVEEHHNVLWAGPVHAILRENLRAWLAGQTGRRVGPGGDAAAAVAADRPPPPTGPDEDPVEEPFVGGGIDALGRILAGIRACRRGGGMLVAPHDARDGLSIHYLLKYDRLLTALAGLVEGHLRRRRARTPEQVAALLAELERRQSAVLRAVRFIAALSGAGGVVLLERGLGVRGFGVEVRADDPLADVFLAGDVRASATRLRRAEPAHFGARQRALIRYCSKNPGSLGFCVSRDGDVQAVTQLEGKVILWEHVDLQPGFVRGVAGG
jgi:hypothetical protein